MKINFQTWFCAMTQLRLSRQNSPTKKVRVVIDMELQTIGQVAKECGVSIRMLRYYEKIGLIESQRKGDGSYRVYDEKAIRRLRQIIVLRKLRVPVKQITEILSNPDAAAIIDIFKQNIDELNDEIATLATVKSILGQFVERLNEAAHIQLELDFAGDEAVVSMVETLSFTKNHQKEKYTMEDLNRASEKLEAMKAKHVRVVYLPPMTVASTYEPYNDGPDDALFDRVGTFLKDTDLIKIKPDLKYFGFGNDRVGERVYEIMISVPDELEVPDKFTKSVFPGGLFAAYTSSPVNFDEDMDFCRRWAEGNEEYEWEGRCPQLEEVFNPFNVYGLKDDETLCITFHLPVKERGKEQ